MKTWTRVLALGVVAALVAGPAFAQGTSTTDTTKSDAKSEMKAGKEAAKSGMKEAKEAAKSDVKRTKERAKEDLKATKEELKATMKGGASREQVRAAQQALKDKGMDPGPADGMMGPRTTTAVREFQQKEGLKATGRLDPDTMAKLGIEKTGAADTGTPAASPKTQAQ